MADENQLRETLESIKRKLMVMQWDKNHNQLNSGKLGMYNEMTEQKMKLETELSSAAPAAEIEANPEISKIGE